VAREGDRIAPLTTRLVFSFADIVGYKKVRSNLARAKIPYRDFTPDSMHSLAERIAELCRGWNIEAATCGVRNWIDAARVVHVGKGAAMGLGRVTPDPPV
jgi:hypothetical protein